MYTVLPDRTLAPWTPSSFPPGYTLLLFVLSNAHGVVCSVMFMAQMSFFTRVAALSPDNGGSVMTLLNTLANLGSMLPAPLVLLGLEALTVRGCVGGVGSCASAEGAGECKASGGACTTTADGYVPMAVLSTAYCVVWWLLMRGTVARLQAAPATSWK
jgi:PAT family acetyl-CoA transporter-like MFS transporter 1